MGGKKHPTVTVNELMDLLDKSDEAIRLWRQEGCPHQLISGRPRFIVSKVVDWLRERERQAAVPKDLDEAEKRRAIAEAQLAELKLEREQGKVVEVEVAAKQTEALLTQLRATILTVPQRVAPRMVGLKSLAEATTALDQMTTELLSALSGGEG